ncbi:hypothetical protein NBG4_10062 [Candidatus Sulfobium mesophilum]|uniref:N-acetyltransferase domain-containing protein n=1 Tax=Candidatus Sulfobium mesophilum TaxID=2016548 RepID=A0A2U3QDM4_9BACT|nr:hypothetical protein NBG4_10062 [Candidatus Sulfobium mesophilum]
MIDRLLISVSRKQAQLGVRKAATFFARRLWDMLFHSRELFFAIDLSDHTLPSGSGNGSVEVREKRSLSDLTEKEQEALRSHGGSELLSIFEKRLAGGHRLLLTYVDGEVAGAAWIYTGGSGRFLMIPLSQKEFFIVAVFIIDRFRGKGISLPSLILLLEKMKKESFRRGFICTKEWNFYRRSIEKAGFKLLGKVRKVRFFGRDIFIWSHEKGFEFE